MKDVLENQLAVCQRYGTAHCPAPAASKVGLAIPTLTGQQPLNGLRHPATGGTCGWFIWAGQQFSESPHFFQPVHVLHLAEHCPEVLPFLGLPPGWRFLLAHQYADVWYDEALLSV